MVNTPLIRPCFLGGGIGRVPLDSHDMLSSRCKREAKPVTVSVGGCHNLVTVGKRSIFFKGIPINLHFPLLLIRDITSGCLKSKHVIVF